MFQLFCAKWIIKITCMERQSNHYRMKPHVETCSGINVQSCKIPDTSQSLKRKHNELKSTSYPNDQNLFSIKDNDSDGNAGKKQKTVQSKFITC